MHPVRQLDLVSFEVTVRCSTFMQSLNRLAAPLLGKYGDLVDDAWRLDASQSGENDEEAFQVLFRDYGLLTIQASSASFIGTLPGERGIWPAEILAQIHWAAGVLLSTLAIREERAICYSLELTWLTGGEATMQELLQSLGFAKSLSGFFANADELQIHASQEIDIPGLFSADFEMRIGGLADYEPPKNVGFQISCHGPKIRREADVIETVTDTMRDFFTTAANIMHEQLELVFPAEIAS